MSRALGVMLVLACAVSARADNLATEWMDRVTHEVQQAQGPLSMRPLDFHVYGGVYGYYTDNLFLTNNKAADGDSAVIGFLRGRADYTSAELEISADLMVNFDYFMEHHEGREDEERFYGKIRWTDGVWDLQVVEIARRESDAIDAVFSKRVRRLVTDTIPRAGVKIADLIKLELFAQIETVRFEGDDFDARENESIRAGVSILGDITPRMAIGVEGGGIGIHYREDETTNSAEGIFIRGVFRGEPFQRFLVEFAMGWTGIRSEDPGDPDDDRKRGTSTVDAEVHLSYQANPTLHFFFDYTRRFGFAGFGDPYEQVDRVVLIGEWEALKGFKLRARGQYDHVRPSESHIRTYWAATLGATYQIIENLALDGGITYRGGDTRGIAGDNYDNWIFYAGVVVGF